MESGYSGGANRYIAPHAIMCKPVILQRASYTFWVVVCWLYRALILTGCRIGSDEHNSGSSMHYLRTWYQQEGVPILVNAESQPAQAENTHRKMQRTSHRRPGSLIVQRACPRSLLPRQYATVAENVLGGTSLIFRCVMKISCTRSTTQ